MALVSTALTTMTPDQLRIVEEILLCVKRPDWMSHLAQEWDTSMTKILRSLSDEILDRERKLILEEKKNA